MRLPGYDYSKAGAYFITVIVYERLLLFWDDTEDRVVLDETGEAVLRCWLDLPKHYPQIDLDEFVVMPNHIHGIIILKDGPDNNARTCPVGAGFKPAPTRMNHSMVKTKHGLSEIVRALKTFSARRINELRGTKGNPVWQRGYYDRIIRNDSELHRLRRYIENNPARWLEDKSYG
jgi:REP element-mobilizing transposase RayT